MRLRGVSLRLPASPFVSPCQSGQAGSDAITRGREEVSGIRCDQMGSVRLNRPNSINSADPGPMEEKCPSTCTVTTPKSSLAPDQQETSSSHAPTALLDNPYAGTLRQSPHPHDTTLDRILSPAPTTYARPPVGCFPVSAVVRSVVDRRLLVSLEQRHALCTNDRTHYRTAAHCRTRR